MKRARFRRSRPRIAIFDYEITDTSPSGSCHLRMIENLCDAYEFTVFATEFRDPTGGRARWVHVPAVRRPLVARFLSYYGSSALALARERRKHRRFDVVQVIENYAPQGDISYVHFCHQAYTRRNPGRPQGLRELARSLDHRTRAATERRSLRALASSSSWRWAISSAKVFHSCWKVCSAPLQFAGMQADVRPYLWAGDVFALPSSYEVFALAPLQAAAAGLPLLVTRVPGVAPPFFVDGAHGYTTEREGSAIASQLQRLLETPAAQRELMGERARQASEKYGVERFVSAWREVYMDVLDAGAISG